MKRRRRFSHQGAYFPDTHGLRAALIDAGQLLFCLEHSLRDRGLLDVRMGAGSRQVSDPARTISVREAFEALHSAAVVFSDCAAVVERVWQAIEQCDVLLDAADAAGNPAAVSQWMAFYDLCTRIASDDAPVRREKLKAAQAVLRAAERKKARGSGGDGKGG